MPRKEKLFVKLSDYYKEPNYIHYSNCHEDFLLLKKYMTRLQQGKMNLDLQKGTEQNVQKWIPLSFAMQNSSWQEPNVNSIALNLPAGTERNVEIPLSVLSVGSGLDNSLAFLVDDNVKVYAFDFNPSQVKLGLLKIEAIKKFSYEELLVFLGIDESKETVKGDRVKLYENLKSSLSPIVTEYFDSHLFLIEEGLVNCGRFEQYFHLFRNKIFPAVCGEKNIRAFAKAETLEIQRQLYKTKINTLRFRLMFKIFFSKKMMAKLGRDKAFFKYSKEKLPEVLKGRVDSGFYNNLNKTNPYYGYVLNTFYPELPFYLQKENFDQIKKNIGNITIEEKTFDQMLTRNYDFMNLSDIFEYMDQRVMPEYSKKISQHLNPKGICAFWNMMNVRSLSELQRINEGKGPDSDYIRDRAFFYRDFLVYEK